MVMVAAISVALAMIVVAVLLALRYRGLVELEWNPLSDASRAARAERAGILAEALWYYERTGQPEQVRACLRRNLSDSPLRTALIEATDELLDLQRGLSTLRSLATFDLGPVPDQVASFAHDVAETLWQTAERIAAASVLWGTSEGLPDAGQQMVDRLHAVRETIRRVRNDLGVLVFSGQDLGGLEMALSRSTTLADTIRELTGPSR